MRSATARAGIVPDVCPISPVFAEFDIVDVRCAPGFEDADELVLRAIERSHAGVVLGPDADILQLAIGDLTCLEHFTDMAPVDALKMDGAAFGIARELRKDRR